MAFPPLTPRVKKLLAVGIGYGAILVAGAFWFQYKYERTKDLIDRDLDILDRCERVRLRMSRDEVLQLLGPAVREEAVPGVSAVAEVKKLVYDMPGDPSRHLFVGIQPGSQKVVEYACSEFNHFVLPMAARESLLKEASQPILDQQAQSVP